MKFIMSRLRLNWLGLAQTKLKKPNMNIFHGSYFNIHLAQGILSNLRINNPKISFK